MSRIISILNVLIVFALFLTIIFLWLPQFQKNRNFNEELTVRRQELENKIEHFKKLNVIENQLKGYAEELNIMDSSIPDDPLLPDLFYFIENLSLENGLILENISSSNISSGKIEEGKVEKISLSISLFGTYNSFKNFLSSIYSSSRIIEVKSISFSSGKDEKGLNYGVSLETLYYSRPAIEGLPEEDLLKDLNAPLF